jgi:hypothetical protein
MAATRSGDTVNGYKPRLQRRLRLALFCASLFLGAVTAGAAPRIFINIDVPGALATVPEAISAGGQVVGWYVVSGSNDHAMTAVRERIERRAGRGIECHASALGQIRTAGLWNSLTQCRKEIP